MRRLAVLVGLVATVSASVVAVATGSPPPPRRAGIPHGAPRPIPASVLAAAHHGRFETPSFTTSTGALGPVENLVPKPVSGPYATPGGHTPATAPGLPGYASYYTNPANVANALLAAGVSRIQVQQVYGAMGGR